MKLVQFAMIALLGAVSSLPAFAQPGPGMGQGMGAGMGQGMGPGMGGRFAIGGDNTFGWALMNQEERIAHQQKMWSFRNYEECKAYQLEHHQSMEARAKGAGKTLPPPHANACDRMKARGLFK
jgi:hypothetical protein